MKSEAVLLHLTSDKKRMKNDGVDAQDMADSKENAIAKSMRSI